MPEETATATKETPLKRLVRKSTEKKSKATKSANTSKAPAGKTAKQLLAEGAKEIKQAQAASKGAKSVSGNTKTKSAEIELIPKITKETDSTEIIVARRITFGKQGASLVLDKETTTGEAVVLLDHLVLTGDRVQFLIGDFINQAAELKSFGGKFAAAIASTGRKLETLKAYAMAARHTPPAMRTAHPEIKYQHLKELVPVPKLEDKKAILDEAVKAAKEGHPLTSKELRKKAEPFKTPKKTKAKPTKPQKPARITRDMTADEKERLIDLEDKAYALEQAIGGAAFVLELTTDDTMTLREKLERVARFWDQIKAE